MTGKFALISHKVNIFSPSSIFKSKNLLCLIDVLLFLKHTHTKKKENVGLAEVGCIEVELER